MPRDGDKEASIIESLEAVTSTGATCVVDQKESWHCLPCRQASTGPRLLHDMSLLGPCHILTGNKLHIFTVNWDHGCIGVQA